MALYDLVGKMLDTPVYNLLGGQVRDRVLLSHSLSMGDPQDIVEQAARLAGEGYQTLKCKVGRDHQSDLKILEAIRREVGDITLRVDANMDGLSKPRKQCASNKRTGGVQFRAHRTTAALQRHGGVWPLCAPMCKSPSWPMRAYGRPLMPWHASELTP